MTPYLPHDTQSLRVAAFTLSDSPQLRLTHCTSCCLKSPHPQNLRFPTNRERIYILIHSPKTSSIRRQARLNSSVIVQWLGYLAFSIWLERRPGDPSSNLGDGKKDTLFLLFAASGGSPCMRKRVWVWKEMYYIHFIQ